MHEYCGRITDKLENWKTIKKLFKENEFIIYGACFEKGKRNENPHYHLLFRHPKKDSYLRKNFFSKHYPNQKYSIKYLDLDKLPEMQRYMSKKENGCDQILLANWNTEKAYNEYWEENDKLLKSCNTITDKLLYHYQNKFKNHISHQDPLYKQIQNEHWVTTGTELNLQDIDIYRSCMEYFRDNSKLIPLDHDMKKYIRTINMRLCKTDEYLNHCILQFFKNY
jgi:hypothetical protein